MDLPPSTSEKERKRTEFGGRFSKGYSLSLLIFKNREKHNKFFPRFIPEGGGTFHL
jgi:hypothetical protein